MLLFISNTNACFLSIYTYFKTSHVIVYHVSSHCSPGLVRISKHLMLLFIFAHVLTSFLIQIISKHLMLLFIGIFRPVPGDPEEFQNISCYCLSLCLLFLFLFITISKHLMLLFINTGNHTDWYVLRISKHLMLLFISDYDSTLCIGFSISKHLMLLFIYFHLFLQFLLRYFKTSHVIVYPKKTEHRSSHNEFQNISCYCLSIMKICSFTRPELFQNISCYRLSDEVDTINFAGYIFQNISCYCLSRMGFQLANEV